MTSTPSKPSSPFFSRSYGGYTVGQVEFFRKILGKGRSKTILDPMAGQSVALSDLAYEGSDVWVGDINPAMMILASLRAPSTVENRIVLAAFLDATLNRVNRKKRLATRDVYVDDWFPLSIREDLRDIAEIIGCGLFADPFRFDDSFWQAPQEMLFTIGILLLAARDITCSRTTDNPTWRKPGGLARELRIADPVRRVLQRWLKHAEAASQKCETSAIGHLVTRRMDVVKGEFSNAPKAHAIITSPPYANRLDYTKLWAPECEVLGVICGKSMDQLRRDQIGTTVMKGRRAEVREKVVLPDVAITALEEILNDPAAYSANYYHPFFRAYAEALVTALRHSSSRLRSRGKMVVFVRDTVRKDVLFPTGEIVASVLRDQCGLQAIEFKRRVIRSHVELLRKGAASGLYGLGQQEWWMSFSKE